MKKKIQVWMMGVLAIVALSGCGRQLNEQKNNIITFQWEITGKGTWRIEGNVLVEKLQECHIAMKGIRTAIKKDNDLEYVTRLKTVMEDEIPDWRNSFLGEEDRVRIVTLTEDKFVGKGDDYEYDMIRIR